MVEIAAFIVVGILMFRGLCGLWRMARRHG